MIKMMIFDLDDTLMSEYDYVLSGFRAVSAYVETISPDNHNVFQFLKTSFDKGKNDPFDYVIEKCGMNTEEKGRMIDIYRYHEPKIPLYDDIRKLLDTIEHMDIEMNILTDGDTKRQNLKIDALDIRCYFRNIIVAEPEHFKPDKWGYELIIKEYSLSSNEILCIGDNPNKDFYYPLSAGMNCVKTNRFVNKIIPHGHPHIIEISEYNNIENIINTFKS